MPIVRCLCQINMSFVNLPSVFQEKERIHTVMEENEKLLEEKRELLRKISEAEEMGSQGMRTASTVQHRYLNESRVNYFLHLDLLPVPFEMAVWVEMLAEVSHYCCYWSWSLPRIEILLSRKTTEWMNTVNSKDQWLIGFILFLP